ncbi:MAG: VOC family protein [Caulobacteraceae bacterium]
MSRPSFIELPSKDIGAAKAFYESVFGWKLMDFGPAYASTMTGDVDVGLQADIEEMTKAPLPVVAVDDLEAALAAVLAAGGQIVKAIFYFPGGRRFQALDPNGNEIAVMQVDEDD